MKHFPMSIPLTGKPVFLIGNGPQIRDKAEKLAPFGPVLIQKTTFDHHDAAQNPAMVIVGDTPLQEAEPIYELCCRLGIPVNVVDVPKLCSFYFPALIHRGDLTVSIATGGASPEAAAYLRKQLEAVLPEDLEQILAWIALHRSALREKNLLKPAVAAVFAKKRPLTEEELALLPQTPPSPCVSTQDRK